MNEFKNILSEDEFFMDIPDCIETGHSYKELVDKSFKLTNGILILDGFSFLKKGDTIIIELIVNKKTEKIFVEKTSDYVDAKRFILGLNKIVENQTTERKKTFVEISGNVVDFGIAYITADKAIKLKKQSLIHDQNKAPTTNNPISNRVKTKLTKENYRVDFKTHNNNCAILFYLNGIEEKDWLYDIHERMLISFESAIESLMIRKKFVIDKIFIDPQMNETRNSIHQISHLFKSDLNFSYWKTKYGELSSFNDPIKVFYGMDEKELLFSFKISDF